MTDSAKPWLKMLKDAETADLLWQTKCDSIAKLYGDLKRMSETRADREFQIFWANLEVLKPTIYSRAPVPVVIPRFKDRRPLPRKAAEVLERGLISDVEADDLHDTLKSARDDLALFSRGAVWVRLGLRDGIPVPIAEHVCRQDFRHEPARKWRETGFVARRSWLSRAAMEKRFKDAATQPGIQYSERGGEKPGEYAGEKKCAVWELWHRERETVVWVTEGAGQVLDQKEPWLNLTGFFPCPRPAYSTLQPDTLTPLPDFLYYRDQVEEINEATARMSALMEALRLRGFYPSGAGELSEAIEAALKTYDDRAVLVPVSSFAALGGGSLKDSIVWLPVREVAEVITGLVAFRRQLIDDVYQITGISDIMRGETDSQETLGAQQLKSQYGSIRVRERQGEMQRLALDVIRLKAEIMAEEVPFDALLEMAQVDDLPSAEEVQQQAVQALMQAQQQGPEAVAQVQAQLQKADVVTREDVQGLFQSQRIRPFVLDIETDSTIQPDENADKQRRSEFVTAIGGFIRDAAPMVMQAPILGPFIAETLQYAANGFRVGRSMDQAIDELAEKLREFAAQPPQPDPAAAQAQAEAQATQAQLQIDGQRAQADIEKTKAETIKVQAETQKIAMEMSQPAAEPVSADPMDMVKAEQASRKLDQNDMRLAFDMAKAKADVEVKRETAQQRTKDDG